MQDSSVDFLTYVVKSLVDNPDAVVVNRTVDEMGVLLTLNVHPEDMGKIIGRKGATAKAIRTLLRVVGMKSQARVNMKINEPEGGRPAQAEQMEESAPADSPAPAVQAQAPVSVPAQAPSAAQTVDEASASIDAAMNEIKADMGM